MPKKKQNLIKLNILYLLLFCLFIALFPVLKKNFGNSNLNINNGANILQVIDQKTSTTNNFFSQVLGYFYTKKYFQNKIQDLEAQVVALKNAQEKVSSETDTQLTNIVAAKKIFSDFTHIYETVVLDKGSSGAVKVGDLVSVYPDQAIGKISQVSLHTSVVALFSKSNEKLEGLISTEGTAETEENEPLQTEISTTTSTTTVDSELATQTQNIQNENSNSIIIDVYGYGGGDFTAKIPNSLVVATGTKVYLAQDESQAIGEVVSIEKKDASFYQILYIRGYYNPRADATYFVQTN